MCGVLRKTQFLQYFFIGFAPHAGYYSEESLYELKNRPVENSSEYMEGRIPKNMLNTVEMS